MGLYIKLYQKLPPPPVIIIPPPPPKPVVIVEPPRNQTWQEIRARLKKDLNLPNRTTGAATMVLKSFTKLSILTASIAFAIYF